MKIAKWLNVKLTKYVVVFTFVCQMDSCTSKSRLMFDPWPQNRYSLNLLLVRRHYNLKRKLMHGQHIWNINMAQARLKYTHWNKGSTWIPSPLTFYTWLSTILVFDLIFNH